MSDYDIDGMFEGASKVQEFQFLGISPCVLALASFGTCHKPGEAVKFQAEFVVKSCETSEHAPGTVVSVRFKPYDSEYESYRNKEAKRMMDLVKALFNITDKAKASETCKKMLDASQPARGMLVNSVGYLGKQPVNKETGEPAKDKHGNIKKPWPNISYSHVDGQTTEGRLAERAEIEKIQKFRPKDAAPAPGPKPELTGADLAASLGI